MSLRRWLLVTVITVLLGFAFGVLPPKKTNPYQGLYLSARYETAFELDSALDQAQTYQWTMHQRPDSETDLTDIPAYFRRERALAVRAYNDAVDRLARKGIHAGRIDEQAVGGWDCNRLLVDVPQAPADALGGQR
jgi:hypothetical protein